MMTLMLKLTVMLMQLTTKKVLSQLSYHQYTTDTNIQTHSYLTIHVGNISCCNMNNYNKSQCNNSCTNKNDCHDDNDDESGNINRIHSSRKNSYPLVCMNFVILYSRIKGKLSYLSSQEKSPPFKIALQLFLGKAWE